ncbi:putative SAC1-recessive suppressor of secretory defect [Tilletiaria anomala UBC 951]|uniref:Putative SAC1-recessive suppressor of secretory defect n=1 Tax=Tilletiaria anomala (strain ATCC 24038 / CBS 436.72 / UBC 951) TaxID=1037660 RepID=A0A066WG70_TILAU|nr:putative SAC1-recessive suppressor of secretory defect [Tilletiaria anomala UBC 951]KDN52776.1 putative SAC1-recessive suppressor of secretory defect [Tilletiaria anomala UBC 951]
MEAHAILGIISLQTSDFLIVVTSRKKVGSILGSDIFLATDFRVLPISADAKRALLMRNPVEKTLLDLLKTHLYSAPFYFSYTYDLTSSMQRQTRLAEQLGGPEQLNGLPMWKRADDRFFWNRHLQERLISLSETDARVASFIQPCLFGFLEVKSATINARDFIFGLIARRSRFRAGTRYFSRGIDEDGHVSNFNETEQFALLDPQALDGSIRPAKVQGKLRLSYVQTRGSVPVFWAEVNNLRYKPDLLVMEKDGTLEAAKLHFSEQTSLYGDVYIANLVNQSGYEKPVKEAYERLVKKLANSQVHYTYYDFHHECNGMKFERVMELVQRMNEQGLESDDYFYQDASSSIPNTNRQQKAVLRTNCMDCLDRTNVVQSTFARAVLNEQLAEVGIVQKGEGIEQHAEFWHLFRNVWADHADVISKAYSGTGALKTDFTRTGKRSKEGALQDGLNSLMRYIKNNFFDGSRQDAYDLFTGAWKADLGQLVVDERTVVVRSMPWVAFFAAVMILSATFLPRDSATSMTYFVAAWIVIAMAAVQFMVSRGIDYVDWPKLNRPVEALFYEGPGYYSGRKGRASVVGHAGRNMKRTERMMSVTKTEGEKSSRRGGRRGAYYQDDKQE